jgi:hypothetical protein
MNGLDNVSTAEMQHIGWFKAEGTPTISNTPARGSGGCLVINQANEWVGKVYGDGDDQISNFSIGFWFKIVNSNAGDILNVWPPTGADSVLRLMISTDQHLTYDRDTTELGSATSNLGLNDWNFIEIRAEISNNTASDTIVAVNGTTEITIPGGSDTAQAAATVGLYLITLGNIGATTATMEYDDIIVLDTSGELSGGFTTAPIIETIRANADGDTGGFSSTETTAWSALASGLGYDSAAYLTASTKDALQSFTLSALSSLSNVSVYGIQLNAWHGKSDARVKAVDLVVMPSGASANVVCGYATMSYTAHCAIFSANPANTASWAVSEIEAMSCGITVGAA